MKKWLTMAIVIVLVVVSFTSGFLLSSSDLIGGSQEAGPVKLPTWQKGQYWVYAFSTPEIENTVTKIVVADIDTTDYHLGINNRVDAQRHAVLNYNPMLGRVTIDNLAIYEQGEAQTILLFPLEVGKSWKFDLVGLEGVTAKVVSAEDVNIPGEGKTTLVEIVAKASTGAVLRYTYDSSAKWLRSMVMESSAGEVDLKMSLVSFGTGYHGDAYFIRGLDLYDRAFSSNRGSPEVVLYDSFIDRGHPNWGPFDSLIYYYRISTGGNSNAVMTIRDHSTTTVVRKTFESSTAEGGIGAIDSNAGEWGVTVTMQGDCTLHLMISGGIEYSWTV